VGHYVTVFSILCTGVSEPLVSLFPSSLFCIFFGSHHFVLFSPVDILFSTFWSSERNPAAICVYHMPIPCILTFTNISCSVYLQILSDVLVFSFICSFFLIFCRNFISTTCCFLLSLLGFVCVFASYIKIGMWGVIWHNFIIFTLSVGVNGIQLCRCFHLRSGFLLPCQKGQNTITSGIRKRFGCVAHYSGYHYYTQRITVCIMFSS